MKNADLKAYYEKGHDYSFPGDEEAELILGATDWVDKTVLEIGCGNGELAAAMWRAGAKVLAIDFADDNSEFSKPDLQYMKADYHDVAGRYDVVVMKGVLEHMDDPYDTLKYIRGTFKPKQIITSSPGFLNPRGYVWQTCQLLFGIRMSMADLHEISPFDMNIWAKGLGADMSYDSAEQDWGHGERTMTDFRKRLPLVPMNQKQIPQERVDAFLKWFETTLPFRSQEKWSGAVICYTLTF